MLLALPLAGLWVWLEKRRLNPNTPVKFGLGIIQAGLGFGALVLGAQFPNEAGQVSLWWLVLAYLLHTTGELCLSPVGLSAVTKLAIHRVVGMAMGTWFLATALAETVAFRLSQLASIDTSNTESMDVTAMTATYTELFEFLMWVGLGVGVAMIVLSPLLKKGMHGVK
jgi:POT family proton-dependent oligopeptide transporter